MMAPMNAEHKSEWAEARALYGQGKTARQIAYALGLPIAKITSRAAAEHWPAPPPPDWQAIRNQWEAGKPVRVLAMQFGVSETTVRKRRMRENWQRGTARGIDALRLAVRTLEEAMEHADLGDTVITTRLAAALSMAAGRLREAEKQLFESAGSGRDLNDIYGTEGEDEAMREQMMEMLVRLSENAEKEETPPS